MPATDSVSSALIVTKYNNIKHSKNSLLSIDSNVKLKSEFNQLCQSYKALVERLTNNAKHETDIRMLQKSIAMSVLEIQIHPYFLCNALNSVAIHLAAILCYSIKSASIIPFLGANIGADHALHHQDMLPRPYRYAH